ncbi:hypothetical protein D3C85_1385300 [compost metagenome]
MKNDASNKQIPVQEWPLHDDEFSKLEHTYDMISKTRIEIMMHAFCGRIMKELIANLLDAFIYNPAELLVLDAGSSACTGIHQIIRGNWRRPNEIGYMMTIVWRSRPDLGNLELQLIPV